MAVPIWRHYVNDEAQTNDDATWKKELPNRGALHAILLKAQCTNGSTSGHGVTILDAVDEIEVKGDGSEILFSLYPTEHEKWYETLFGKALQAVQTEVASGVQEMVFPIIFGKKLYDPKHWLPLSRFKDVSIEVKYSPSISADGGFATGTMTFDLMLLMSLEEAGLGYEGTLVTRRIKSYTTAASGEEEIELPDNAIIRAIGNYVYEAGVADGTDVTKVELEDKATGVSLFEADWDDFIHLNRELFGSMIRHSWHAFLQDNDTLDTRIGEILEYALSVNETPDPTADTFLVDMVDAISGDRLTFACAQADITAGAEDLTAYATDHDVYVTVKGKSPSYFGLIPFTYQDDPSGWLNTGQYGKLTVIHTQGGAGGNAYVSIQEYRRY